MTRSIPGISSLLRLLAAVLTMAALAATPTRGDTVFDSDFGKGNFGALGWNSNINGTLWAIGDYQADHPALLNGPGPVAIYHATKTKGMDLLIKKFKTVTNPSDMTLTFDAGWGWGGAGQGADAFSIMLLDDDGNGYIFAVHRTKAAWAAQWGLVTKYVPAAKLNWSPTVIDGTQKAVIDGGGLQTFTIRRGPNGAWAFSGANWAASSTPSLDFQEGTTSSFSQVALCGTPNFDDILFNKVKLDVTP